MKQIPDEETTSMKIFSGNYLTKGLLVTPQSQVAIKKSRFFDPPPCSPLPYA